MKRVLALVLAVGMLTAMLAACGDKGAAASSAAASAPAASKSAAASASTAAPTGDATLAFVFKNKTGLTMTAAYLYPAGSADKGENFLASSFPTVKSAADYRRMVMIRPAAEMYECYVEYESGETATYDRLNMMQSNSLSIKALDEKSGKNDPEVSFTEEEIAAALASGVCEEGATAAPAGDAKAEAAAPAADAKTEATKTETKTTTPAKTETKTTTPAKTETKTTTTTKTETKPAATKPAASTAKPAASTPKTEAKPAAKTVKLTFTFKNKTGSALKEAYVYASGASDKGSNVLKGAWKDNASEADYLELSVTVADAAKYDIHVVSTDGKTCTYSGLNLKDAASASMKDLAGTISVKDAAGGHL